MTPKISIVIPTFQQGIYIRDCLDSILNQSFRDFEVIIQDAESRDSTQEICTVYAAKDPRILYFRELDTGQSDGINRGLARSRGKYWTWLCSDDCYAQPKALENLNRAFDRAAQLNSDVVGVYGDANMIADCGSEQGDYPTTERRDLRRADFQAKWPLSQPASLLLRSRVLAVGAIDASLHLGMDLDLFIKMLDHNHCFIYEPTLVASVRIQDNSKSVKLRADTAANALGLVMKHFGSIGDPRQNCFARELSYVTGDERFHIQELRDALEDYRKAFSAKGGIYYLRKGIGRHMRALSLKIVSSAISYRRTLFVSRDPTGDRDIR